MSTRFSSTRGWLSIAAIVLGAVLLAAIPVYMIFLALSRPESVNLPGTLVILTSVTGMGLVAAGAVLRD